MLHHHAPFPVLSTQIPHRKKHIYIGFDFGTTYTKISYSVSGTVEIKVKTIAFGDGDSRYFHPSEVWLTPEGFLHFALPSDITNAECLRYFKYSMALPGLAGKKTHEELRAISAFFIGCMLTTTKQRILEAERLNSSQVEWHVNLGIPAGTTTPTKNCSNRNRLAISPLISDEQMQALFHQVLNVGHQFSMSKAATNGCIRLSEMQDIFKKSTDIPYSDNLHCVPELFAEVLLYYQDPNIPDGLYCVCDVGGGTVDIAVFFKEFDENGPKVECLAHAVAPIGFEKLVETTAGSAASSETRDRLANQSIPYRILSHECIWPDQNGIRGKCLTCLVHRFEETCGLYCINAVLNNRPAIVNRQAQIGHNLSLFLLGGGCSVKFYEDVLSHMCMANRNAGFPPKSKENILDYINDYDRFVVKDNPRIIISQMLAQPFELIPELNGASWRLDKTNWNDDAPSNMRNPESESVPHYSPPASPLFQDQQCPNGWTCTELELRTRTINRPLESSPHRIKPIALPPIRSKTSTEKQKSSHPIILPGEYCLCPKCRCRIKRKNLRKHLNKRCAITKQETARKQKKKQSVIDPRLRSGPIRRSHYDIGIKERLGGSVLVIRR